MARENLTLAWLHTQASRIEDSCDPPPLEERLRSLDPRNGAGWLEALHRASPRGDIYRAIMLAVGRNPLPSNQGQHPIVSPGRGPGYKEVFVRARQCIRWASAILLATAPLGHSQQSPIGVPVAPLGSGPWVIDTAEQHKIRVSVVTRGLSHPWAIAFLPGGDMLVTERAGRLRLVRNGVLDPQPISGLPAIRTDGNGGLMDIALHPRFESNQLVYFTYTKPVGNGMGAPALARGRLEGHALLDVKDLLVPDFYAGNSGLNGRVAFGPDGKVYMSTGGRSQDDIVNVAQDRMSLRGKVLRLNDDGTVPQDNPFVGRAGHRPEIFTLGHRNTLGLIAHPVTGQMWQHENGPNGGDEINILLPGRDYGWPQVSFGRDYSGRRVSEHPTRDGIEPPLVIWVPAIAVAGMAVYTGNRFPAWKGNVFVGGLMEGRIPGTGHLQRIVFNERMEEIRRESMLRDFRQRIREVREGPDGFLYLLTDEEDGALLRIEPST